MAEQTWTEYFRGLRSPSRFLHRGAVEVGEIPVPRITLWRVLIGYIVVCYGLTLLFPLLHLNVSSVAVGQIGNALVLCFTCYPLLVWIFKCIKTRTLLTSYFLRFPPGAQYWYSIAIAQVLLIPIHLLRPDLFKGLGAWNFAVLFGGGIVVMFLMAFLDKFPDEAPKAKGKESKEFGLYLGTSTGTLGNLGHGASLRRGQNIALPLSDSAQNILVLGGIGSGKTTRAVQPLLLQLLDQDCGGLIFDIKGDFKVAVEQIAHEAGREIIVIGPEKTKMNLLSGLTPEVAASFLKSALLLNSRGHSDPFWIDTATELCKNSLGVLSFFPKRYSLESLHAYLFDPGVKDGITLEAESKLESLSEREKRLLKSYMAYNENIFSHFDDKVKSGVNASVAQILSPFNHPDLVDAFCTDDPKAPTMESVLDGAVYLVDMPLSKWGLGGKVAYNFIKLRFFNVMQRRNAEVSWNHERPVFFMCDEFQEIVSANRDGLSDINFWDKSRSSKCIGIISAQAVSSFYAAIGQRDLADSIIQNFRQKVCFKTEDSHTIEMLNHLLGRVEVTRESHQKGTGSSSSFTHFSDSKSTSVSTSKVEKQVINPQLFRTMGQNQAIALFSFGGASVDDVIECVPLFVS